MTNRRKRESKGRFREVALERADPTIDLDGEGSEMLLPQDVVGELSLDEVVQLAFTTLAAIDPLKLPDVGELELEEGHGDLSLAFGCDDDDLSSLLRREFNRRSAPRVWPSEPIDVLVEHPRLDEPIRASMIDVSPTGIGLSWPRGRVDVVAADDPIELRFVLPDSLWECHVRAALRAARWLDDDLILHIEFEPHGDAVCPLSRQAIHGFVVKHWDAYRHKS